MTLNGLHFTVVNHPLAQPLYEAGNRDLNEVLCSQRGLLEILRDELSHAAQTNEMT